MKKNVIYKLLLMAIIAVVSMSFTACGGNDSEDDTIGVAPGEGGAGVKTSIVDFTIPCLNWTWTKEQVKQYMTGNVWTLQTEAAYELVYERHDGTKIQYAFGSADSWNPHTGLDAARVTYKGTTVGDFNFIVDKVQKQYNVTMEVYENEGYHGADITFNLDGKDVQIVMMRYPQGELHVKWIML